MRKTFILLLTLNIIFMLPIFCHAFDKWPDTGQVKSYTDTFGEDSDYITNQPSYTKLGSGGIELLDDSELKNGWIMTRDNVTGALSGKSRPTTAPFMTRLTDIPGVTQTLQRTMVIREPAAMERIQKILFRG